VFAPDDTGAPEGSRCSVVLTAKLRDPHLEPDEPLPHLLALSLKDIDDLFAAERLLIADALSAGAARRRRF
jgi:hypothetical protein